MADLEMVPIPDKRKGGQWQMRAWEDLWTRIVMAGRARNAVRLTPALFQALMDGRIPSRTIGMVVDPESSSFRRSCAWPEIKTRMDKFAKRNGLWNGKTPLHHQWAPNKEYLDIWVEVPYVE